MKIKTLTEISLLLAIGFVLHTLFPPIIFGMKPDFSLAMLFSIIIIKRDFKLALIAGLITGIFTALTTSFPGGQIANIVDKIITTIIMTVIILKMNRENFILVGLFNFIGTIISGVTFLGTAAIIFGLPGPMLTLILTVVLPTALINTLTGIILYSSIVQSKRLIRQTK
ncbi:tryptophan transporter [Anoxybacter fermentans]|uniref:Tryptophan transporter n=1 Tax=Anoxybacter fermentans TaxID=1323375 RepID=A0A3Q9HSC5_9FIRM|nr:tryptophan transporter [Anoxybacter fermentans]AZR74217.1 tryptophan transporter [Anoxybacter fermentans]